MVGGIFEESAHREPALSDTESTPTLRTAFVDAYPVYVATLLTNRGVQMDVLIADAIVEGTAVLDGLLTTFEQTPLPDQRVSPLELFREALRPVDRAMAASGIPAPTDAHTIAVAPWDRYALSPGSSQVLGSQAHDAHLRWAVTKASAVGPAVLAPRAFIASGNQSPVGIAAAVESVGYRVVRDLTPGTALAVIASSIPEAHALVAEAVALDVFAVVYGENLDDLETTGLRALGASAVVSGTRFMLAPEEILPSLA